MLPFPNVAPYGLSIRRLELLGARGLVRSRLNIGECRHRLPSAAESLHTSTYRYFRPRTSGHISLLQCDTITDKMPTAEGGRTISDSISGPFSFPATSSCSSDLRLDGTTKEDDQSSSTTTTASTTRYIDSTTRSFSFATREKSSNPVENGSVQSPLKLADISQLPGGDQQVSYKSKAVNSDIKWNITSQKFNEVEQDKACNYPTLEQKKDRKVRRVLQNKTEIINIQTNQNRKTTNRKTFEEWIKSKNTEMKKKLSEETKEKELFEQDLKAKKFVKRITFEDWLESKNQELRNKREEERQRIEEEDKDLLPLIKTHVKRAKNQALRDTKENELSAKLKEGRIQRLNMARMEGSGLDLQDFNERVSGIWSAAAFAPARQSTEMGATNYFQKGSACAVNIDRNPILPGTCKSGRKMYKQQFRKNNGFNVKK